MNTIYIGIGGTGVHSLIALIHLKRLLNEKPLATFVAGVEGDPSGDTIVIDADTHNPLDPKDVFTVFRQQFSYSDSHYDDKNCLLNPTLTDISGPTTTFSDVLGGDDNKKLFFEEKQLQTKISEGFQGEPAVGAATFAIKIESEIRNNVKNDPLIQRMNNELFETTQDRRIIIISSHFGGTGAGCTPALARFLKSTNGGKHLHLINITHSKWFRIDDTTHEQIIARNVAGGLSFLQKEIGNFEKVHFVDMENEIQRTTRKGKGSGVYNNQEEQFDFPYLYSAFVARGYALCKNITGQDIVSGQMEVIIQSKPSIFKSMYMEKNGIYGSEKDFFTAGGKTLWDKLVTAYKSYYFLVHLKRWLNKPVFSAKGNPLHKQTREQIWNFKGELIARLDTYTKALRSSLEWLEKINRRLPQNLKDSNPPLTALPSEVSDFDADRGDTPKKLEELGIKLDEIAEKFVVSFGNTGDLITPIINKTWELFE